MKLEDPLLPGLPDLGSDCFLLLMKHAGVEVKVLLEVRGDVLRDQLNMAMDTNDRLRYKKSAYGILDVDLNREVDQSVEVTDIPDSGVRHRGDQSRDVGDKSETSGESRHGGAVLWLWNLSPCRR